jgi:hypothetical protein
MTANDCGSSARAQPARPKRDLLRNRSPDAQPLVGSQAERPSFDAAFYCAKHPESECAGERLSRATMWALVLRFLHEKPAESFRPLV